MIYTKVENNSTCTRYMCEGSTFMNEKAFCIVSVGEVGVSSVVDMVCMVSTARAQRGKKKKGWRGGI